MYRVTNSICEKILRVLFPEEEEYQEALEVIAKYKKNHKKDGSYPRFKVGFASPADKDTPDVYVTFFTDIVEEIPDSRMAE